MPEQEPPEIIKDIAEGGEPVVATTQGGVLTSYVAGKGATFRGATNTGEVAPGVCLYRGWGVTEEAREQMLTEMEEYGGKKVGVGADSPEVARSVFGWSGGDWDENYGRIFGPKDPKI